MPIPIIDTHTHLDGSEFAADLDEVMARARQAGVARVFLPAINLASVTSVLDVCTRYAGYAYPMIGLHPEEVNAGWADELARMKAVLAEDRATARRFIAVGEVGLDYYW